MYVLRILVFIGALFALHLATGSALAATPQAVHHEARVHLDPESRELRVEDRFTVEVEDLITFDLAPWLALVEARVDGKTVATDRVGNRVSIPKVAAGLRQVEVRLRGLVPALPAPDARGASRGAVADAEGSYLPGSAAWLPDTGDEWIEYDLIVEVPEPYRVVATGGLVEETVNRGSYRASFASDHPAEMPSVFAGPYLIAERRDKDLRIRAYLHAELAPLADEYMKVATAYIRRYAERIGPYPYADFHIVSAPLPVGLGFPNLTYVGRMVLPLPFMRGRSLAHEILHSWWGNGVAVDYDSGNWAEGLTTYMADYALVEDQGDEAARKMRQGWLRNLAALPPDQDMPVERFTVKRRDAAQVVGYDKVAFIFHMLKAEVGDKAFAASLQRFWEDNRFRVADWSDLENTFEATAGRDLAWFFNQWLRRAGAPRIEFVEAKRAHVDGEHRVALTIRQSPPAYRIRLPIVVDTASGSRRYEIDLERTEQTSELAMEHKPLAVHIDPDFDILRRLLTDESPPILRDVTLSGETVLVVPTKDAALAAAAHRLARALLQREPKLYRGHLEDLNPTPVIVIGSAEDIDGLLARTGRFSHASEVDEIVDSGTARAWAERQPEGDSWLFVSADDAASLDSISRPLPHYRGESYVVFDGAKSVRNGLWQGRASPLSHRFAD